MLSAVTLERQILKSTTGSTSDIAVGAQVSAQGMQNADGSVTAQSIQLRPAQPVTSGAGTNPVQ